MPSTQRRLAGQHIMLAAEYLHFGGTRDYLLRLLDLYFRQGAQVTLVTTFLEDDSAMEDFTQERGFSLTTFPEVVRSASFKAPEVFPTVWSRRNWSKECRAFRIFAEKIRSTRSVVSVGTPGMLLSAAAAHERPIVFAHGYPHGRRQELFGRFLISRMIPDNTTFISLSEFETRAIDRLWDIQRSASRVVTVLSTDGDAHSRSLMLEPPLTVLCASLVEPYKEPIDWLAVADLVIERMPKGSVQFVWLGEGSLLESARREASRRPSGPFIKFPGLSLDPEPEYARAAVYLQMSSIENMSLSVLKAQKHAIPCVVTDAGGLPEIITDGVNGFLVPTRGVREAADAVYRLLNDSALRQAQSAASLDLYARRHSLTAWEAAILTAHEVPQVKSPKPL